jgi:hypothetical protein
VILNPLSWDTQMEKIITKDQLKELIRKADTGEQWAEICRLEAKLIEERRNRAADDPVITALAALDRVRERCAITDKMYLEAQEALPRDDGRLDELDTQWNEALTAEGDAEAEVFKTAPTTPAGAIMLLRTIADYIDEYGVPDVLAGDFVGDAIRNAVATLESGRTA